nr:hypothetical protein DM860_002649 [Ipomoea batatas]
MKDVSFFLLKNSFGAKMRRGFRNFCNDAASTSTLNQQQSSDPHRRFPAGDMSSEVAGRRSQAEESEMESQQQPTLEEMLFRLDMEEKMAARRRREKLDDDNIVRHRMSCVNSSDILRTARNALNQYPRFSLDGKDAMYRSSFRHRDAGAGAIERSRYLPSKIGGERVIWCKPGVVAKLMGLDALPVPLRCARRPNRETTTARVNGGDMIRRQNLRRRAEMERHERRDTELMNGSSCSTAKGYCVLKPVAKEDDDEVGGWPIRGGFLYSKHNLV